MTFICGGQARAAAEQNDKQVGLMQKEKEKLQQARIFSSQVVANPVISIQSRFSAFFLVLFLLGFNPSENDLVKFKSKTFTMLSAICEIYM